MDVYVISGKETNIKSQVMRALTGCWKGSNRVIQLQNGAKIRVQIDFTSFSQKKAKEFINEIQTNTATNAVLIQLDDIQKKLTIEWLNAFLDAGWNIKKLFILASKKDIFNSTNSVVYT